MKAILKQELTLSRKLELDRRKRMHMVQFRLLIFKKSALLDVELLNLKLMLQNWFKNQINKLSTEVYKKRKKKQASKSHCLLRKRQKVPSIVEMAFLNLCLVYLLILRFCLFCL